MHQPLISIIIPVYNREHLVGETLDSIIAQTYTNWQCVIIDDSSTDNTVEVLKTYHQKDNRIQYFKRDISKPKGANACRNSGLEIAKGEYIIFFDSDDLMTPNHIEVKVNGIKKFKTDYIITKTQFFNNDNKKLDKYYKFDQFKITPYNYISQNINWLTYDVIIKSDIAKSIKFNEQLQSGQEYNYFSKLVYKSTKAKFIDQVVTLRRFHNASIRSSLKTDLEKNISTFNTSWITFKDIKGYAEPDVLKVLLNRCIKLIYKSKKILPKDKIIFIQAIYKSSGFRVIYALFMMLSIKIFKKGFIFRQLYLKNR